MGHRALVAVEDADGRYSCYRSQWGGLAAFGSVPPPAVVAEASDHTPLARDLDAAGVLESLDRRSDEALFVDAVAGGVRTYLVCRLGVPTARGDPCGVGPTALVPVTDPATAREIECVHRTLSAVLGDAVDAGLVTAEAAVAYLGTAMAGHPDVTGETLWLLPPSE